jgi:hypothetical protein
LVGVVVGVTVFVGVKDIVAVGVKVGDGIVEYTIRQAP